MLVPVHSSQEYAFLQQLTNNNGGQDAWLGGFYLQVQTIPWCNFISHGGSNLQYHKEIKILEALGRKKSELSKEFQEYN